MPETTEAMTSRSDSSELPFAIHPIADLVVDVVVPTHNSPNRRSGRRCSRADRRATGGTG